MKRIILFLMLLLVFLFYWNTDIANHTEAEDAFKYARMVEVDNHPWLYHSYHLLYGISAKGVYRGLQAMGYGGRAYPVLVLISSLTAAGSVFLFFRFCYRRYSMRPVSSLFAAGFLALSYGFWRYACEAEVMLPAAFLALWAVYLATAAEPRTVRVVSAALIAALSVLFHVMNGVPVFVVIPLFYMLKHRFRYALIHVFTAGLAVIAIYGLIYFGMVDQMYIKTSPTLNNGLSLIGIPKAVIGFGQCLASGSFLFGCEPFVERLMHLFPERMLMEEAYLGKHISGFRLGLSLVSFVLLFFGILMALYKAAVAWKNDLFEKDPNAKVLVNNWRTLCVLGLWFMIYALALLILEPGNPEVWVLGLIPFWLLVCGLVIAPIARENQLWIVLLVLLLMGTHNYAGGIALLKNPEADYNRQKAAWVLNNTGQEDVILTAGNAVFFRYLEYYSEATVADLNYISDEKLSRLMNNARHVYVLDDVFEYMPSMRLRFPEESKKVDRHAIELRPRVTHVVDNEFGGVWLYTP